MNFPMQMTFKIVALAPQATIRDADGKTVAFVRQKLFKFRERVEVFGDSSRSTKLAEINANKILDWSTTYKFTQPDGSEIGSVQRKGLKSLWRAHYEVMNPGDKEHDFTIRETNPWAKVADQFLGEIPVLGFLSGYLFHPKYEACRRSGEPVMTLTKRPAFFEGKFSIEKCGELSDLEELNLVLSFMMMNMLERRRG